MVKGCCKEIPSRDGLITNADPGASRGLTHDSVHDICRDRRPRITEVTCNFIYKVSLDLTLGKLCSPLATFAKLVARCFNPPKTTTDSKTHKTCVHCFSHPVEQGFVFPSKASLNDAADKLVQCFFGEFLDPHLHTTSNPCHQARLGSDPVESVFFNGFLEPFSGEFFKALFGNAPVDLSSNARGISKLVDSRKHLLLVGSCHEEFFNPTSFT